MGKTAGNAVWLDPNKDNARMTSYQYWRNVDDSDVHEMHPYADLPAA